VFPLHIVNVQIAKNKVFIALTTGEVLEIFWVFIYQPLECWHEEEMKEKEKQAPAACTIKL
jgi:hypothetical protein